VLSHSCNSFEKQQARHWRVAVQGRENGEERSVNRQAFVIFLALGGGLNSVSAAEIAIDERRWPMAGLFPVSGPNWVVLRPGAIVSQQ